MPHGFILDPTYRLDSGRATVTIHGVLEGGAPFLLRDDRTRPHFWIRAVDAPKAAATGARVALEDPPRRALSGDPVARVTLAQPADASPLRERLARAGIVTFEADVRFAYRYLIERGIRGAVEIVGPGHPGPRGITVFTNPDVCPSDWTPTLSVLSIDIETDPRARRLLSVALEGCGVSEVLLLTPDGMECPPSAEPHRTETALLRALVSRMRAIDPDVLVGWNVVDFDLATLERIAASRGVSLRLGRTGEPLRLRPMRGARGGLEARIPGRVVLDGIGLLRGAFLRFESYSLDAVAREILGEGKSITGSHRAEEILDAFENDREHLVEYNRKDARLALEILESLQLVELAVERSRLTGMPLDRVAASIASFDFLYLSELTRRNVVAPTVDADALSAETLTGGHVLEPLPGLYEHVLVLDFQSLYPSIIRTFQIDPLGHDPDPDPESKADRIVAPNGAAFSREPAILPGILDELMPARERAKAEGDRAASQAIKILMNSFYGVLGTPACRFASPALSNAITGFGREILLWCRNRVESRGLRVLYGDTDSLFVESAASSALEARTLGNRLVRELNEELATHVRERWRVESRLRLELDALYLRLLLPEIRGGQGGARKRYAGLVESPHGTSVVFTGMESVRSDWTPLAKRAQRELFERLFSDRSVEGFLRRIVNDVREGRLDELLVYRKRLRKKLDTYVKSTPPHVAAARKLGRPPGRTVRYVVTLEGPEPVEALRSPIDHEHYVQRQIRPVAEPVLGILDLEFDRVIGDDKQLRLFED